MVNVLLIYLYKPFFTEPKWIFISLQKKIFKDI